MRNNDSIGCVAAVFIIVCVLRICAPSTGENYITGDGDIDDIEESMPPCGFVDDSYTASVQYHNPDTDYSATYILTVEVEDCEVVRINFPKGGWLDDSHITPAELDEYGRAVVHGEDGKTYEVEIDD